MRIVITGVDDAQPLVLDNMDAFVFAARDDSDDGTVPCYCTGEPGVIMGLAASVLISIRNQLGEKAFERTVDSARKSSAVAEDITDQMRAARRGGSQ